MSQWGSRAALNVGSGRMIETADWLITTLQHMGVSVLPSARLFAARRLIQDVDSFKTLLHSEEPAILRRVAEAQRTLTEFYIVVRAIESRPSILDASFLAKLQQMMGGAESAEDDKKSLARDTQFELYVLAQFLMGGATVSLGEPDVRFDFGRENVGVAVKRLSSNKRLENRLRAGARQIEDGAGRGFVAINLDPFVSGTGAPRFAEKIAERGAAFNRNIAPLHTLLPLFAHKHNVLA